MPIRPGTFLDLPSHIKPGDLVLDVGGGLKPLSRADYVIDFLPWGQEQQLEPYCKNVWPDVHFSKERWVQWDLCSHQPWPFDSKQFDFAVCKQTLEDLRDPIAVCYEIQRVARSGFIEVPSRAIESMPGIERSRYCGFSHHHWLCELTEDGIEFTFKHAQMHAYSRFHLTVGPDLSGMRRDHNWSEAFDGIHHWLTVLNRWFREPNPKYSAIGFFWSDSFTCREKVLIDKGAVEADLMAYRERCRDLNDLWVWKRTWYGKRVRH